MMPLNGETIAQLIQSTDRPCISIYQPTHRHRPDNSQDPIRFNNLLRRVEESLALLYRGKEIRTILEPLQRLAEDASFWNHTLDGLAVLWSGGAMRVFKLQRPVKELAVVADSFHIKPLIRLVQSADRYQVLCLTRRTARVFEGNRDVLDDLASADLPATIEAALGNHLTEPHQTVASYGRGTGGGGPMFHGHGSRADEIDKDTERYFRAVDRAVNATFSKPSGLPLILVALAEHQPVFRTVSQNSALLSDGVAINPDAMDADTLRTEVWKAVEPRYIERLALLSETFSTAAAHQRGTGDLSDAARAAVEGRVATLLIENDRVLPGMLDVTTGAITPGPLDAPDVGDMLDDLAEAVLRTGGEVIAVPAGRMPTSSGLAATLRY